jgi:multidrug efflux pump subunit AcrB
VKVRYTAEERSRLSDLEQVRIRTAGGFEVPLMSVAEVTFAPGYSTITRTDGMRRVAVSAGVDTNKANANEIFAELSANYFPDLKNRYPGFFVDLQGEQKKCANPSAACSSAFPWRFWAFLSSSPPCSVPMPSLS